MALLIALPALGGAASAGAGEADVDSLANYWLEPVLVEATSLHMGEIEFLLDKSNHTAVLREQGFAIIERGPGFASDIYLDGLKQGVSVTDGGDQDVGQVKVLGGDCNDSDGVQPCDPGQYGINVNDATIVGTDFGNSPPADPRADINDDGTVNILDAALLGGNWHKCSPVTWP